MAKALMLYNSSTAWTSPSFAGPMGTGGGTTTEVDAQYAASHSCQIDNLRRKITSGGSGSNILRLRKNTADGNLVCTGTGTGVAEDITHSDSFVTGDVFCLNHSDDGTDPVYRWITAHLSLTGAHGQFLKASTTAPVTLTTASATRFQPLNGLLVNEGTATIASAQWINRGFSKIDAFQIRVTANTRPDDSTVTIRRAGTTVAASTITIPAGGTGLFLVTDLNEATADGDTMCAAVALGVGVGTLSVGHIGATVLSTGLHCDAWMASAGAVTRAASATATYYVPAGSGAGSSTTEADVAFVPGFSADIRNLRCRLSANTYSTDATLTLFKNGVATGLVVTLTAGATGFLENTVDEVEINSTDTLSMQVTGGGTGSISITCMGFTLFNPTPVNPSVTTPPRRSGGGIGFAGKIRNSAWPFFSRIEHD